MRFVKEKGVQNLSNHRRRLFLSPVNEEIGRIFHDVLIIRAEYAALGECNDRQYEQHQPRCTHHSRHDGVYDKEPA
jgi:hypothetical protein